MTRGRRIRVVVGVGLIMAGLGVLGWFGWQLFGTNWVSHRAQSDVVGELEETWSLGEPDVVTEHGTAQAVIRIPRFGTSYAVPVLAGTSADALAAGFGHFKDTAEPGGLGNFALAAHRITHGEPLRDMPALEPGDRVLVETRDTLYTYELSTGGDDLVVAFTDSWVVAPQPVNPDPDGVQAPTGTQLITLTTCSELFHTDDRLVAFGVLVETAEATRPSDQ